MSAKPTDEGAFPLQHADRPALKTAQARRLRKSATYSEGLLWQMLRGRAFEGLKFRRQAPIGPYIVDFACLKRRLIVELDGGIHFADVRDPAKDKAREDWLVREGYRVVPFCNSEIENQPNEVLRRILEAARGS